uniref:(northern house mosquito) hypothetical protein n=1 Tax=Culex pipiens TaxID=7175 RepID=A0A8D8ALW4_CULPI
MPFPLSFSLLLILFLRLLFNTLLLSVSSVPFPSLAGAFFSMLLLLLLDPRNLGGKMNRRSSSDCVFLHSGPSAGGGGPMYCDGFNPNILALNSLWDPYRLLYAVYCCTMSTELVSPPGT